mgnify:FL=1
MRALQILLTGILIGSFAIFGWVYAQGNNRSGALTGSDLAEIHHLHSQYNQGTDFGNAELWLNAFTEDAIFRIGDYGEWVGREQMTEWRRQSFAPRSDNYTYRHWNSSWVITPSGEGEATGRIYWLAFDPTAEVLAISDTGVYEDIYVKTANGWRIKQRHAHPDARSPEGGQSRATTPRNR